MHATKKDRETRARVLNRLKRLEGQVRGLQKMVEEERNCLEILTLLAGVKKRPRGYRRSYSGNLSGGVPGRLGQRPGRYQNHCGSGTPAAQLKMSGCT
jgi:hypothetical protein